MKHQFLLFLALLGALLLWPGCEDDDDGTTADCEVTAPKIPYSSDCTPEVVNLINLIEPQIGALPTLPGTCTSGANSRIVRLDGVADGTLYLHLYVGIPATITYEVFGADCEDNVTLLQECESSNAVAIASAIEYGGDYSDIYVRIKYDLFTTENYVDYALRPDSYISVAAYDELPKAIGQSGGIDYQPGNEDARLATLAFNCDESSFQRIVITSCDPDALVSDWATELGLITSEEAEVDGFEIITLYVPEGMNTDFVGDGDSGPGGADTPISTERRPKRDSSSFIVEQDYIIEVASSGNGLFPLAIDCANGQGPASIGPDNRCFKPSLETLACLAFKPGNGSTEDVKSNVVVTMIDSGADDIGIMRTIFNEHIYKGDVDYTYLLRGKLGYDFLRNDNEPEDEVGHGTATGATLVGGYTGQAPLTVVHYKIFGAQNLATYYGALLAVHSAIETNSTIINMSWGIPQDTPPAALECAMDRAKDAGITMVTTAGNEDESIDDNPQWPGAFSDPSFNYTNLFTIGSMAYPEFNLNEDPVKVQYSNYSPKRVNISAYLTAATPRWKSLSIDDINYIAGTSISAPIITRSLASYIGPNGGSAQDWFNDKLNMSATLENQGHVQGGFYLPLCADVLD